MKKSLGIYPLSSSRHLQPGFLNHILNTVSWCDMHLYQITLKHILSVRVVQWEPFGRDIQGEYMSSPVWRGGDPHHAERTDRQTMLLLDHCGQQACPYWSVSNCIYKIVFLFYFPTLFSQKWPKKVQGILHSDKNNHDSSWHANFNKILDKVSTARSFIKFWSRRMIIKSRTGIWGKPKL